ncbi:helix-turn-helix transcriptional regulator [Aciduricibacillus chroicocephali]|uniref:Helix-turn-helix transcriptional regulator n=1 Tax=Aciduricibacillus chroicocephali TaxID=3054939 RepID=A0ABY9KTB7_9BACI|nr:helix-turn-helix transcriptional regulator [Bacillaceae bacterium 44XB]
MNDLFKENELEVLHEIGKRLKSFRKSCGFTQEMLASKAGFSRSYYSDIETGKRNISILNLCKLTIALDISLSDLLLPTKEYAAQNELEKGHVIDPLKQASVGNILL